MSNQTPRSATALALSSLIGLLAGAIAPAHAESPDKARVGGDRVLAVYLPADELELHILIPQIGAAVAPVQSIEDAGVDAGRAHFRAAFSLAEEPDRPFNEVLVLHPKWDSKDRDSVLTMQYKVLDASGAALVEGVKTATTNTNKLLASNAFYTVALGLLREIFLQEALRSALSDPQAHVSQATRASFDANLLVSREKPMKSGTGFFINDHGQIMTAAHVVHDCPVSVVKVDGKPSDSKRLAESVLLDLAVLDSGLTAPHVIPLRTGTTYDLGEGVTNIGFPLEGVLAGSPNVTRGNISSRSAMAGALGEFQFSAPVQPGSSGGPVVSDTGELLGVTVGTLAVNGLIQKGVLPQNVNFALDAQYVARFLDRNQVRYETVAARPKPDGRSATDLALPAVVQVLCYE